MTFLSKCFACSLLQFIVLFVVKVLTGQMKGVNDVREYEDGDDADHQTSADGWVETRICGLARVKASGYSGEVVLLSSACHACSW